MDLMTNLSFVGAKIALLVDQDILVLRRDDVPNIPWPNAVDLPGGGSEPGETPLECALRETNEEISISVSPDAVVWERSFPEGGLGPEIAWFFIARIGSDLADQIRIGDEGQATWKEPISTFLAREDAIPFLQDRLLIFLEESGVDQR